MSSKNILAPISLTGASGFLGSYLAERLPFPQKRLSRQSRISANSSCKWVVGDINNPDDVLSFVQESPTLIHLACNSYPNGSNQDVIGDVRHNLLATIQLFEAFAKANPHGHVIFSSSGGNMYEASHLSEPHTEEDVPHPRSGYAIHKLASEHYLRLFCTLYGIRATILRISNPYGVLLPSERKQGIIGVALKKILENKAISIFDSLLSVRDYVHLEDVTRAFHLALARPPKAGECRLFNVSSGVGYSLEAVLNLIAHLAEKPLIKEIKHPFLLTPSYSVLSHKKIHSELGWSPTISLENGIEQMVRECAIPTSQKRQEQVQVS